jgi:hypothetical protein
LALVFVPTNGIGLGHYVRAGRLCQALADAGDRPVIFSQGVLDDHFAVPGRTVPSLETAADADSVRIARELRSMAEISLPAVVIEDTHPVPLTLPRELRRVLVVRPTVFSFLTELNDRHVGVYSEFLLADMPRSPTWPYSGDETRTIATWPRWTALGPVYRRPAPEAITELSARYRIDERRLCVLTMGGGGLHRPTDPDAQDFVLRASAVADAVQRIDPGARFLFVTGPHFPGDVEHDERFEIVPQEPRLPALLALARMAVVRSGYNTLWECIAAGVPLVPFIGTTYMEPNRERLSGLRAVGLLDDDVERLWGDDRWREGFRRRCAALVERYPGAPDPHVLQALVRGSGRPTAFRNAGARRRARRQAVPADGQGQPRLLLIRVDDVVAPESALEWLLSELAARCLRASLEVVPYLSELDESSLIPFDAGRELLEVSQHGYAHIVRSAGDGRRYEFRPDAVGPTPHEEQVIRAGRSRLVEAFPQRFRGGFSAPFDALPAWLPRVWRDCGGTFVSHIGPPPRSAAPLPLLRVAADIWDWSRRAPRPANAIVAGALADARAHGHTGIVIHPHCLRSRAAREHLIAVLEEFARLGLVPGSVHDVALGSWPYVAPAGNTVGDGPALPVPTE